MGKGPATGSPLPAYSRDDLKSEVTHFEGRRDLAYPDSMGNPTIGVGHLIDPAEYATYGVLLNPDESEAKKRFVSASHRPLKPEQINSYLDRDIDEAERTLDRLDLPWRSLDPVRQRVLVNMAFQLGQPKLSKFTETIKLLKSSAAPDEVAKEMLKSKWANVDTRTRARWLADAYATGSPAPLPVLGRSEKTP
jgi:lysozyme